MKLWRQIRAPHTAKFERVGNDKVWMGWDVYRGLLIKRKRTADF